MENHDLVNAIESLVQKLDGIGIEIYHLNSTIASLKCAIQDLAKKDDE